MNVIALIPARGGSKRIPGKNIAPFCGKPLIAWTIEQAKRSRYITRVIVSTDDQEIARVARESGAEVPFMRPSEIAQDDTPDLPVFEHLLKWMRENEGVSPDIVAHLRVVGPLRRTEDIDRGIELLIKHPEYDSVRAVIPAPLHPLKTYRLDGERLAPFVPEGVSGMKEPYNEPVQKLPKAYAAAGYFSAIRPVTVLEGRSMTGRSIGGYEVPAAYAVDIDTPEEFSFAEARMKRMLSEIK